MNFGRFQRVLFGMVLLWCFSMFIEPLGASWMDDVIAMSKDVFGRKILNAVKSPSQNEVIVENKINKWLNEQKKPLSGQESKHEGEAVSAEMHNGSNRPLDLYWTHPSAKEPVFQGTAGAGSGFTLNTFGGHSFFWAEQGSLIPLHQFTVTADKIKYAYVLNRDGSINSNPKLAAELSYIIKHEEKYILDHMPKLNTLSSEL